jgi:hypothetical protein
LSGAVRGAARQTQLAAQLKNATGDKAVRVAAKMLAQRTPMYHREFRSAFGRDSTNLIWR